MLKEYNPDSRHVIEYELIELQIDLSYVENPIEILEKREKILRNKVVNLVKLAVAYTQDEIQRKSVNKWIKVISSKSIETGTLVSYDHIILLFIIMGNPNGDDSISSMNETAGILGSIYPQVYNNYKNHGKCSSANNGHIYARVWGVNDYE
ncbi:hypothetical protein AgCh_012408 [Apium graveolens]